MTDQELRERARAALGLAAELRGLIHSTFDAAGVLAAARTVAAQAHGKRWPPRG